MLHRQQNGWQCCPCLVASEAANGAGDELISALQADFVIQSDGYTRALALSGTSESEVIGTKRGLAAGKLETQWDRV